MKGSNLSAHRGLKNVCSEIERLLDVVVRLFVQMYRHFGGVVSFYVEKGFVRDLVLNLGVYDC